MNLQNPSAPNNDSSRQSAASEAQRNFMSISNEIMNRIMEATANLPSMRGESFTYEEAFERGWISSEDYRRWKDAEETWKKATQTSQPLNANDETIQFETGQDIVNLFRAMRERGNDLTQVYADLLIQLSGRLARGEIDAAQHETMRARLEDLLKQAGQ